MSVVALNGFKSTGTVILVRARDREHRDVGERDAVGEELLDAAARYE
jgi:hypothetical protein